MAFDSFRRSLEDLIDRATSPDQRRSIFAQMRDTIVGAKAVVAELQDGLAKSRVRLDAEVRELETVRRRRQLADRIGDRETEGIAAHYEQIHVDRVQIVRKKVEAEEAEISLAEREVAAMSEQLKSALAGAAPIDGAGVAGEVSKDPGREERAGLDGAIGSLARRRTKAEREAEAQRGLDELKRRMGK